MACKVVGTAISFSRVTLMRGIMMLLLLLPAAEGFTGVPRSASFQQTPFLPARNNNGWIDRSQSSYCFDGRLLRPSRLTFKLDEEADTTTTITKSPATEKRTSIVRDLYEDGFFPLILPLAQAVDDVTGGWGLSYADLHPETETTPAGILFLITNLCYAVVGLALGWNGEYLLGTLTEIAGFISLWYHYSQLKFGQNRKEVRLALLTDYIAAISTLIVGGVYMIQLGPALPWNILWVGLCSAICLIFGWIWESGYAYLFWHGMWHILSAATGFLVGNANLNHPLL